LNTPAQNSWPLFLLSPLMTRAPFTSFFTRREPKCFFTHSALLPFQEMTAPRHLFWGFFASSLGPLPLSPFFTRLSTTRCSPPADSFSSSPPFVFSLPIPSFWCMRAPVEQRVASKFQFWTFRPDPPLPLLCSSIFSCAVAHSFLGEFRASVQGNVPVRFFSSG